MDIDDASGEQTFDRWYAPYAPPLNRAEFLSNIDRVGSRLLAVAPSRLPAEDEYIRRRWLTEPGDLHGLFSVNASNVAEIVAEAANATAAAGVLSMHPSGHVREAAVKILRGDESSWAVRFLLIRCGDWVPEVRRTAETAIEARFDERHLAEMLACLGLLNRLSSTSRGADVAQRAIDLVSRLAGADALVLLVRSGDLATRRAAAAIVVKTGHSSDALETAMRQSDPKTLRIVAEAALSAATGDRRDQLLRRLLSVRSTYLAELALWTLLRETPDADPLALEFLRDRRSGMRWLARHQLQAAGFDVVAFYRGLLPREPVLALRGLGESGDADDAIEAVEYLSNQAPAVRRAGVEAVARLDAARCSSRLLECLADDVANVAATSARWLARVGLPAATTDELWNTMNSDRREHVTRACARATRGLPRWSRLLIALRSIATNDEGLAEIGTALVDDLLLTWNRSYTAPASAEILELTTLLDSARAGLGETRYESLVFAVSSYGIASARASELKETRTRPPATQSRGPMQRLGDVTRSRFKRGSK